MNFLEEVVIDSGEMLQKATDLVGVEISKVPAIRLGLASIPKNHPLRGGFCDYSYRIC